MTTFNFPFKSNSIFVVVLRTLLLPEACWIHVEVSHFFEAFWGLFHVYHSCASAALDVIMTVVAYSCDSGPMRAYVLAREDAIRHWRELMGPTKVFRARHTSPNSIRAQFGLTDTRNTTHGSGEISLCILICSQMNNMATQSTYYRIVISGEYCKSNMAASQRRCL